METRSPERPLLVALEWITAHCVIPDGARRGEPYVPTGEQLRFLANHYDVREDAIPDQNGTAFVFRRSQLVRPQKWGKSPLTAAMICLEGAGPALFAGWSSKGDTYRCRDHGCGCGWAYAYEAGEPMGRHWPTPVIQVTATSEEQTANVYLALRPMIELGPLVDVIRSVGEQFIRLPGDGRIDTVTSSSRSRLGQRVTFVVQDETGIWTPTSGMVKVAATQRRGLAGMGGRSVETTNAWDPSENSVAQQTAEGKATDVYRDHLLSPTGLSYTNKAERRRIHKIVYGESLKERGGWVDLDAIEGEAAELIETDPANAERFFGNRIVAGSDSWWSGSQIDKWDAAVADLTPPRGARITLGFDGSQYDDWTAIRARWIDTPDDVPHGFTPLVNGAPTIWNPLEHGGETPRQEVLAAVEWLFENYQVERMYVDPYLWQSELDGWAAKYGTAVVSWPTSRVAQMSAALERLSTDTAQGSYTHDGCQVTRAHLVNARKWRRGQHALIGKPAYHQKIDVAMADALAHEACGDAVAAGLSSDSYVYYY